jgi:hypothetical protein
MLCAVAPAARQVRPHGLFTSIRAGPRANSTPAALARTRTALLCAARVPHSLFVRAEAAGVQVFRSTALQWP